MKERPILFSGAMVRAILDGRKTHTRRVICTADDADYFVNFDGVRAKFMKGGDAWYKAAPWQPGDLLWVRETIQCLGHDGKYENIYYTADDLIPGDAWSKLRKILKNEWTMYRGVHNARIPSIHMPRWASRITLLVKAVRVERLQSISEADARAEGVSLCSGWNASETKYGINYAGPFSHLWQSINGKRPGCSWGDNPWVWVIEFERIEKEPSHA